MKIVTDLEALSKASGGIWNGETKFKNEENRVLFNLARCAGMIESFLAYNQNDFMTSRYAKPYIEELGWDVVNTLWTIMNEYFDRNCFIKYNTYTDCEGLSYNSLIDRQEV